MPSEAALRTTAAAPTGDPPLAAVQDLTKAFGGIRALRGVSLDVRPGEIHAIVGHNGAGKSTLIKCLSGAQRADSGSIWVDGSPVPPGDPAAARERGLGVVYQELSLFPSLTVAENLHIGLSHRGTFASLGRQVRQARRHLDELGLAIDPRATIDSLSIGQQQLVEIARVLSSGARLVVLDEPTSSLSVPETRALFQVVHSLAQRGVGFILISHFIDEVLEHADRVTVLRGGQHVGTHNVSDVSPRELVELSLGSVDTVMTSTYENAASTLPQRSLAPLVMIGRNVHVPPEVHDMDIEVAAGEIVVVYGDLGSGHEALCEAMFGLHQLQSGRLVVLGHDISRRTSEFVRDLGVGYIPADRRSALALENPLWQNVTLASLRKIARVGLRTSAERETTGQLVEQLGVRGASADSVTSSLSGGNQQKALFARWLIDPPKLLLLCEPTRGMDVGAKSDVLHTVTRLARSGTAVLLATSEPETALGVADRIVVARRGSIVADLHGRDVTRHDLVEITS
jgi:ribose transport system ATP-binding protein